MRVRGPWFAPHRLLSSITAAHAIRPRFASRQPLPGSFLPPDPPDNADRRGLLLFAEHAIRICEKRWLVREVPAPFVAHQKSLGEFVLESSGGLLQSLGDPAEQAATVGQIL